MVHSFFHQVFNSRGGVLLLINDDNHCVVALCNSVIQRRLRCLAGDVTTNLPQFSLVECHRNEHGVMANSTKLEFAYSLLYS